MRSLREQISRLYYSHGLYVSSHPTSVILLVICLILFFCYPLRHIPLPENAPVDYITYPQAAPTDARPPPGGPPLAYIAQVVLRAAVHPWARNGSMAAIDALLAPLLQSFEIVREIERTQTRNGSRTLADLCLQVGEPVFLPRSPPAPDTEADNWRGSTTGGPLPTYACLMTGPDNLWNKKEENFKEDGHVLRSIYAQGRGHLKDILFGVPWKETGVSRFLLRSVQRVITFSVTLVFREFDPEFVAQLTNRLRRRFPLTERVVPAADVGAGPATVVVYREKDFIAENKTLAMAYIVLFFYVYFSVRKIEMVKSKWGLAFSACFTVVASLLTSIGICVHFGLTPTLNGSEIFPYLVVLIGLENVLVITKSVVATSVDLPVKYRVAQGLSKEGWPITKNLLGELSLLAIGFFTFNPAIQEFCLFALIGFTTDFFLQMFFFVTVLSIDIRRMELSEAAPPLGSSHLTSALPCEPLLSEASLAPSARLAAEKPGPARPFFSRRSPSVSMTPAARPGQHRRTASDVNTAAFFNGEKDPRYTEYVPRRLRFLCYWAQTRVFHRVFKFVLICWILVIVYSTGIYKPLLDLFLDLASLSHAAPSLEALLAYMQPLDASVWTVMAYYHWPLLFRYYNISLSGRHIKVMPPIHLAHVISPEEASLLRPRHPLPSSPSAPAEADSVGWVGSSTLAGWADLGLTATLLFTCVLGVTAVLTSTYLAMCVLAWLTRKGRPGLREQKVMPLTLPGHSLALQVERWATCSPFAAFSFVDSRLVLTRVDSGEVLRALQPKERLADEAAAAVWSLQVAPDGSVLVGLSNGELEVWPDWSCEDVHSGVPSRLHVVRGLGVCSSSVRCSEAGLLELTSVQGGLPGFGPARVFVGTAVGGVLEVLLRPLRTPGREFRFGTAHLGRSVSAHPLAVSCLALSPDSTFLASAGLDFSVKLFDARSLVHARTLLGHEAEVTCLTLEADLLLSGAADGGLLVSDLTSGRCLLGGALGAPLVEHAAAVCSLAVAPAAACRCPTARLVVSGDRAGKLCLWRLGRPRPLRVFSCFFLDLCPIFAVVLPKFLVLNCRDDGELTLLVHNLQSNRAFKRLRLPRRGLPANIRSPPVPVTVLEDRYLLCFADHCLLVLPVSAVR